MREEQADRIAQAFHESYERQAPDHSYQTRERSAVPWENVPDDNKNLMRAVVADLLNRGVIHVADIYVPADPEGEGHPQFGLRDYDPDMDYCQNRRGV